MPDRTNDRPPATDADSSWQVDLAGPALTLRLGVALSFAPAERSVVICLEALSGTQPMSPVSGLAWSRRIGAPFAYFPGPDRTVWFSPDITFAGPVDRVCVTASHWPTGRLLSPSEVTRMFLRVADGSAPQDEGALSTLYFAPVGGPR